MPKPLRREWISKGDKVHVEPGLMNRLPTYDVTKGEHFWAVATTYRVDPTKSDDPTAEMQLDSENLYMIVGPFCYFCEERWTQQLHQKRCQGEPGMFTGGYRR